MIWLEPSGYIEDDKRAWNITGLCEFEQLVARIYKIINTHLTAYLKLFAFNKTHNEIFLKLIFNFFFNLPLYIVIHVNYYIFCAIVLEITYYDKHLNIS